MTRQFVGLEKCALGQAAPATPDQTAPVGTESARSGDGRGVGREVRRCVKGAARGIVGGGENQWA